MTEPWQLPTSAANTDFGDWTTLASAKPPTAPGLYLLRSRHLASASGWPSPTVPHPPWLADGLIYVGVSLDLAQRVEQFVASVDPTARSSHSGAFRFRALRELGLYRGARDVWQQDLEIAFAVRPSVGSRNSGR